MDEALSSLREEIATLRASEERYRFLVESIPQLVWSCDATGLTTDFSERCLAFMGMTREEARGSGWTKAVHPDDLGRAQKCWETAVREGSNYSSEYRIKRASDGAYLWFKASASPMRDANGRIVAWFGTSTDVDAEKKARQELDIRHAQLRAVLTNSPTVFFSTDERGIINLLEGAGLEALGLSPADCIGLHASVLCEDDDVHAQCIERALKGESCQQYHERNGLWLDIRYVPLIGGDGQPIGMTCVATDFTALKRADDERKKSHELLKTVLSGSPMVFWATDSEGILTLLEGGGLNKLGIEPEEFIGKPATLLDRNPAHSESIAKALRGESSQHLCERDGHWMDCRYKPIKGDSNRVLGVTCVSTDVTSEKQNQSVLEESEARYRSLTEAIPVLIWMLQPTGIATFINKAFEDFTGIGLDDYNSLGHKKFLHPDDLPVMLERRAKALASGAEDSFENRYRSVDGSYRWFLSRVTPVRADHGQVIYWIGTAVDIHERKIAEEALQASEERLRYYLESTRDGVWDYDLVNGNRTWSDRHFELLGLRPGSVDPSIEALQGQLHPGDFERLDRVSLAIESGVQRGKSQFRVRDFDGEYRWRQSEFQIFRNEAGEAVRAVGATTDIHDQKTVEEQILKLNEQLEERVHERTKELEATTGELQEFCYSVSHDLRGPLRSINGFSQALEEDYGHLLDEAGRDHLSRIRNATIKLADLIDALLSMSRITRAEMERRKVDLSAIALSVVDDLQANDRSRNVEIIVAPGLETYGDGPLLQVALTNLIENAWKFTSKTEAPRIEIGAVSQSTFFVKDNGVGFDAAYSGKLFSPFQRLHSATDFPGTGIGLAIVSRVIQRHGGTITASAEIGKGAQFTFTLPSRQNDRSIV